MGVQIEGCSVKCVIGVEGGVGDAITPVNTRKTDDLIWDEEDDRRVAELRKWMQDSENN